MLEWFDTHRWVLIWTGSASLILFIATLIIMPILVIRIPADYFVSRHHHGHSRLHDCHPIICLIGLVLKNLLGVLLVLIGIVMLLTPGQGLLTVVVGLLLINFPGKYEAERWLVSRRPVSRALNWVRSKGHVEPLTPPDRTDNRPSPE